MLWMIAPGWCTYVLLLSAAVAQQAAAAVMQLGYPVIHLTLLQQLASVAVVQCIS